MNKTLIALALLALAIAPAASAGTQSGSYAAPGGIGGFVSFTCTNCANAVQGQPEAPEVNLGGANILPDGGAWLSVTIADASGGPVSWSVGQDLDGDTLTDVQSADFCSTTEDVSALGFDANLPLAVFVNLASPDCSFVATSGEVFAQTADAA